MQQSEEFSSFNSDNSLLKNINKNDKSFGEKKLQSMYILKNVNNSARKIFNSSQNDT